MNFRVEEGSVHRDEAPRWAVSWGVGVPGDELPERVVLNDLHLVFLELADLIGDFADHAAVQAGVEPGDADHRGFWARRSAICESARAEVEATMEFWHSGPGWPTEFNHEAARSEDQALASALVSRVETGGVWWLFPRRGGENADLVSVEVVR